MLDEHAAAAWGAIISDRRVLVPLAEIGAGEDAVDALASEGLVSVCMWVVKREGKMDELAPHVTLTPLSASRLGLRVERRRGGRMEWTTKPPKRRRPREADAIDPAREVDPKAMRPDEIASINERIDNHSSELMSRRRLTDDQRSGRRMPEPSVLLTGCRAWPVAREDGACPVCKGRKLRASTYCLVCDRWGLDWLLARVTPDVGRPAKVAGFRPAGSGAA